MHIVLATGALGGPARYTKILAEELPKKSIEVSVVSFGSIRHLPKVVRHIVYVWKLLRSVRINSIIFAQDPVSVGLPACIVSFLTRRPYIVKIVGDYAWEQGVQRYGVTTLPDEFVSTQQKHVMVRALQFVEKFVARRAQKIIVPSTYLKNYVAKWGLSEERICIINNAFDSKLPHPTKSELQVKHAITSPSIISVGRFVPWKGFEMLIDTFLDLHKKFPGSTLRIVGEGPMRHVLEQKVEKLNLKNSVYILGQLAQDEVLEYIKASDLFVLNTGYEGLSHLILEAMAVGTPIVTTDVGGNGELITNEVSGVLIPYNNKIALTNAIIETLNDTQRRESYSSNAEKKIQVFNKDRMIEELCTLLHFMVG